MHAALCYTYIMLNIHIRTVPDKEQRYDTVSDYRTNAEGKQTILVSDMPDTRYEILIAIHELVESYLCQLRGVTDAAIDSFDLQYEKLRVLGDTTSEPGDDPAAPYYREHKFATKLEKLLAEEIGVDWDEYSASCASFTQN